MNSAPEKTSPEYEVLPTPQSNYVSAFRYDKKGLRLEVTFKYGAVREHWPIYPQTWLDLQAAPSKGKFYSQAIKRTNAGIPVMTK